MPFLVRKTTESHNAHAAPSWRYLLQTRAHRVKRIGTVMCIMSAEPIHKHDIISKGKIKINILQKPFDTDRCVGIK